MSGSGRRSVTQAIYPACDIILKKAVVRANSRGLKHKAAKYAEKRTAWGKEETQLFVCTGSYRNLLILLCDLCVLCG